jgi:membrane fusion protein, heavy metal efflux system
VTEVYATTGDYVHAGQPLFSIAASELAQAQNDYIAARAALVAAQVQLDVAGLNYPRQQALLKRGGASKSTVEQAFQALIAAQSAFAQADEAVNLVRARLKILGLTDAQIKKIDERRAISRIGGRPFPGLSRITTDGVVPAPISGYVISRAVGVGTNIGSATNGGTTALFTISDLATVYLVAYVPETAIASIHVGDRVAVTLQAFPGRTFDGPVRYIAATVDPNLHRIAVRAAIANTTGELRPGMFGTFRIYTGAPSTNLAVPEYAVIYEEDTARVWIAGPNKTLALRYIKVGKTIDGMVQVLAGLQPGETVVTSGTVFIDRAFRGDQ